MFLRKTLDWGHHLVKVTYDYMLELAARKNAMLFLFIVAFVESSFFPIPPDIMLIPMVLATPAKAYRIAGLATVASVLGGYFGYLIGVFGYDLIAKPILTFYGICRSLTFSRAITMNGVLDCVRGRADAVSL